MSGGERENRSMIFVIIGVLLMVGLAFIFVVIPRMLNSTTDLYVKGSRFSATIVKNSANQGEDWSEAGTLSSNQALLIEFASSGRWSVSPGDLKSRVDVAWLDDGKNVVYMVDGVSPDSDRSFMPDSSAKYAVELPSGTIKNLQVKLGQQIVFNFT